MAFGKPKDLHQQSDWPIEETESAVLENPTTQGYPGFKPQMPVYQRPIAPHQVEEIGEVPNNVMRGTEAHGLYGDSHVAPQDAPELNYSRTTDNIEPELAEYTREDKFDPINVRVVDEKPNEITRIVIGSASVTANLQPSATGPLAPVRLVGQDPKRVRTLIGTSGTVTGVIVLLTDLNQNPVYGWPLPSANAQPLEIHGDQELWVSGVSAADTGTVVSISERMVNGDAQHPSN